MPAIDWSINLGTVIHLVTLVVALAIAWGRLSQRLKTMESEISKAPKIEEFRVMQSRIDDLWTWFTTRMERRNEA